jgi:hypothetical protein
MRGLVADLSRTGRFTPAEGYQRFAYWCAALLVLSGIVHLGVYVVDRGPWEGPLSWRKPIVFGLSFGIALATLSWVMTFIRPRRLWGWVLIGVFSVASVLEVALITMQTWRGVASHFNEDTPFDGMVFSAMGMLVAMVALVTVAIAVRALFSLDAPPSLALAIRAGLVLMLVSQAVGVQMIVEGGNTFGADGALKVPHAFTLHVAQVLPALAILLLVTESPERRRIKVVVMAAVGYGLVIASTGLQAYAGRAPLDLDAMTTALALVGLALMLASALLALRGLARRPQPPATPPPGPMGPVLPQTP